MYVTMFCFSIDAAGIAAITGSIAHLLSDGSFTFFFALLSHLKYLIKFYQQVILIKSMACYISN